MAIVGMRKCGINCIPNLGNAMSWVNEKDFNIFLKGADIKNAHLLVSCRNVKFDGNVKDGSVYNIRLRFKFYE
jgi:hypothetical protein